MSKKDSATFHNEDAVFRIAMWSNIVSWAALAFTVLELANVINSLSTQWDPFTMDYPEAFQRISILGNLLFAEPIKGGIFIFLALQGLSQLLYLAMDFYLEDDDYDEDDGFEDVEGEEED